MESIGPGWLVIFAIGAALLPLIVVLLTCYLKISIVFNILKSGLGTQNVPGPLIVMALSLSLSLMVMAPQINKSIDLSSSIDWNQIFKQDPRLVMQSLSPMLGPWRDFVKRHAGERERAVLVSLIKKDLGQAQMSEQDVEVENSLRVILPAFLLSELKEAFAMSVMVLLPFVVIDLIVANILVGLGMYMLSPVMVSLPLKIFFFVVSDAWLIITKGLVYSYMNLA